MSVPHWEVVDALIGMACQFLEDRDGRLDEGCVSASEIAVDVLSRLGLLVDGRIVNEAFDHEWLKKRFNGPVIDENA